MARKIERFDMVCVKTGEVLMSEPEMLNLEHAAHEHGLPVVGVGPWEDSLIVDCGCGGHMMKCGA